MDTNGGQEEAIRILSLDNGGAGSYGQLVVIREYMARLANSLGVDECDMYPADYFDLIGGVGFGGLVAILLGHLRMNVDQASEALVTVAHAVFPSSSDGTRSLEANTEKLREAVEEIIQGSGMPLDLKMNDKRGPSTKCKVVLYAATSTNLGHPTAFRTYSSRGSSLNPTIVEAVCATIAAPSLFSPVKIGPRFREQSFVGGAIGANNPTRQLLREASDVFGKERRVSQILSIGSGRSRVVSLDQSADTKAVNRLLEDLASDCETVASELSARLFNVDAYLRLNVDRGMETVCVDDWSGLGGIESHTNAYVETPAVTEALEASLRRLQERIGTMTLGSINHSSSIRMAVKVVPTLSPYHVVRKKEQELMRHHLVEATSVRQKIFPITGMGGCGKTQLVSYFVEENEQMYTHVVFVDASSHNSIKTDLQAWARSLGDGHEQDAWEDAIRILANGFHNNRWLLILDNADDPRMDLMPYFPKCKGGTIILTSRNRDVGNLANTCHLELGEMTQDEALSTLLQSARREAPLPSEELESARKLMGELGCLAVALVHVGTYCRQLSSTVNGILQPYTFTQYLTLFSSQRSALMTRDGPVTLDGYQRGVYATLNLSYQAIPSASKDFFHVLSCFHYSDISVATLEAAAKNSFRDRFQFLSRPEEHHRVVSDLQNLFCSNGHWSELRVQEMVQTLRSFSLVSTTIVSDSLFLQIHPLVQSWARDMLLADARHSREMAQTIIASSSDRVNFLLYRHLVPHIEVMLANSGDELHIRDQMAVGHVLYQQGRYHDAEVLFSTALKTVRDVDGDRSTDALKIAGLLGSTFRRQGRLGEAEKLALEVLEQRHQILGTEHRDSLMAASKLALAYTRQGRSQEAEKLQLEVLEKRRRVLGTEHKDTIWAAANLASIYHGQGRWAEAEKLELEVLEKRRRVIGAEHPDTIMAAAKLGRTYASQKRWNEAEELLVQAVELGLKVKGKQHRDTKRAIGWLIKVYKRQGKSDKVQEVEKLLE